jgi:hypothetical protein
MKPLSKPSTRIQKLNDEEMMYSLRRANKKKLQLKNALQRIDLDVYLAKLELKQTRDARRDWMFFFLIVMVFVTLIAWWFGTQELAAVSYD